MHKTDTPVRFGNVGGSSWAQALVSPRMLVNKFPRPYAIPKNIIIRSKHDAFTVWTCPKVITEMVFLPFRLQIIYAAYFAIFFLLHNVSKHYSVWLMTPVLCNSSPHSQKGGVAVLCPVAVLGTSPYRALCVSVLLYGSKSLSPPSSIASGQTCSTCAAKGASCVCVLAAAHYISNQSIRERTHEPTVSPLLRQPRLRLFGHLFRMPPCSLRVPECSNTINLGESRARSRVR